ncbi:MAG: MFS transporter [Spirochaetaceae bacterium]|jgi:MFS family permease|nr:MFS transporter [Spirochaetaceae bacterium]
MLGKLNLKPGLVKQFLIVCIGSEAIYHMYAIRNVLFNPYRDMLGLTNTQLGLVLSVMGMVAFFGGIPSAWVLNRFSARRLMSINLIITGLTGFYMISPFVSFPGMMVVGVIWGFSMEAFYWGAVTKSIRCLAPDDKQGIAFGTMEFTRGLVSMGLNIFAVSVFAFFSESLFGIRVTVGIVGAFLILMGILTRILLPEEDFLKSETPAGKSKESLQGVIKCLKTPQLWLAGFMGMGVYAVYMGCSFFLPFLQDVLMVPVLLVAIFGIASTNWVRMASGPISGFMANKLFKSSTALMRILFLIGIIFLAVIIIIPKNTIAVWPITILLIILQVVVYMLRGVYYAPIGESGIPKSISGSAMAVSILLIQSPMLWAFALYGYLIDKYPGGKGFSIIFIIMISLYGVGFIASDILLRIIKKQGIKVDTGEELSQDA